MNFAPLEALLETFRSDLALPGAEISLRVEHKELFRRAVGFADLESGVPLRGGELYYFYSATKPITCAAVMQLLERKLLSLDDPILREVSFDGYEFEAGYAANARAARAAAKAAK